MVDYRPPMRDYSYKPPKSPWWRRWLIALGLAAILMVILVAGF